MAMSAPKRRVKERETEQSDYAALQCYLKHRSHKKAAEEIGVKPKTLVDRVTRALTRIRRENWEDWEHCRARETERLWMLYDEMLALYQRSLAPRKKVHRKRYYRTDANGNKVLDREEEYAEETEHVGNLQALDKAAGIIIQIVRINGWQAPERVEHVVTMDRQEMARRWDTFAPALRERFTQQLTELMLPKNVELPPLYDARDIEPIVEETDEEVTIKRPKKKTK